MSTPKSFPRPSVSQIIATGAEFGLALTQERAAEFGEIMEGSFAAYDLCESLEEVVPQPSFPRRLIAKTPDHPLKAWYATCQCEGAENGPLAGKTVALKDNIFLAGIPMANGSSILEGFIPKRDATVVTRLLQAGASIAGKAVCENFCMSGASFTSASGMVLNPHDVTRSAGGSSSGCAALVANGDVDLAVGGDQGGSIRIPSSHCGIVGMKPTHGLVPYTGAMPIEATLDHVGPMTRTLRDNALMLGVIAGPDGLDPRQNGMPAQDYLGAMGRGPKGLRVGVLDEGFTVEHMQPDVAEMVRGCAETLRKAGVEVVSVSIPEHKIADKVWAPIGLEGLTRQMMEGLGMGFNWRGQYAPELMEAMEGWRERAEELPVTLQISLLAGSWVLGQRHGKTYAKAQNLSLQMRAAYDAALSTVDALLMPTLPYVAPKLPDAETSLIDFMQRALGVNVSTSQFDVTGHPALTVPCGALDGLPVGAMLVGPWYGEAALYRIASALME
ncbi:amidase (plasmid) [Thioclava sp. 'Guangxiensis']|uniref:amidase n=1 Tax=Thioclava sp. 'Guangxiensis' TaxID=3149044 RepID=UPI0032C40B35